MSPKKKSATTNDAPANPEPDAPASEPAVTISKARKATEGSYPSQPGVPPPENS